MSPRKWLTPHACTKSGITDLCQGYEKLVSTWPARKYSCSHGNKPRADASRRRCTGTKGAEIGEEGKAGVPAGDVIAAATPVAQSPPRHEHRGDRNNQLRQRRCRSSNPDTGTSRRTRRRRRDRQYGEEIRGRAAPVWWSNRREFSGPGDLQEGAGRLTRPRSVSAPMWAS